jgi:hypothetical protein
MATQFIDGEPDGLRLCNCVGSLITTVCMPRNHLARTRQLDLPSRGIYYQLKVDGLEVRRLYADQTTQGVNRLNDHNQKKPWWDRAVLFLSDDSNNFTLDTVSGLGKYAIQQTMDDCPDIVENKVAPKYMITKFQWPFIESLYGEVRFMMATMRLRMGKSPTDDKPAVVPLVDPGPPAVEAASPAVSAEAVPVSMTKRKMTVQGPHDSKTDELVVLRGSPIDLVTPVLEKDKATGSKRQALLDKGQLIDNGNGTGTLLVDVPLPSPTAAAQFAFGGSINGRKYWKVGDGKSIKGVWE